ncbi:hypothetical protein U9M48_003134 [Paspalum notatum var. saurae]|uniref:Uncharacterized protein n=1 Tax=Paspalum notatum var. saurae TaxID=547442 RepID=A0AAQ3PSS1_PASNO
MKTLADSLVKLGEVVTDRALGMNVLRGLSDQFHTIRLFLKEQQSFPSFAEIRFELLLEKQLLLEELTTALVAATSAPLPTSTVNAGSGGGGFGGGGSGGNSNGGANGSRRHRRGTSGCGAGTRAAGTGAP